MKANRLHVTRTIVRILPLILSVFILSQCRGPRGKDGLDGINYTHSAIYDVSASSWSGNADGYTATISVPEITQDIYYNGAVLVYRLIETDPKSFNMLPYTYVDNTDVIYFDYDAFIGSIDLLHKVVSNGVNNTAAPVSLMSFKVIIIEGISLNDLKKTIDVKNYNAVSKFLNMGKY